MEGKEARRRRKRGRRERKGGGEVGMEGRRKQGRRQGGDGGEEVFNIQRIRIKAGNESDEEEEVFRQRWNTFCLACPVLSPRCSRLPGGYVQHVSDTHRTHTQHTHSRKGSRLSQVGLVLVPRPHVTQAAGSRSPGQQQGQLSSRCCPLLETRSNSVTLQGYTHVP